MSDATPTSVTINLDGRPVEAPEAGEPLLVRWSAPANGVSLLLTPPQGQSVTLRWVAISDGWPEAAAPLPARPADAAPWGASDGTVVIGERLLTAP